MEQKSAICDYDMHLPTPFHTPYSLFCILYLLISHVLTDVVYIRDIYAYFVYTVRIYVISGPGSRYFPALQKGKGV